MRLEEFYNFEREVQQKKREERLRQGSVPMIRVGKPRHRALRSVYNVGSDGEGTGSSRSGCNDSEESDG